MTIFVLMKELAQHIEALLLENDCVIIPDFGGFIAHYSPAKIDSDTGQFLPPCRTIGFTAQLILNDGLLTQSYMSVHDINFPQATRLLEKEIKELSTLLFDEGKATLPNVGELHYTMQGTYTFAPQSAKLNTTSLYGLETFEMKPLHVLRAEKAAIVSPSTPKTDKKEPTTIAPAASTAKTTILHPGIGKSVLRYAAVAAAAILFFFVLSKPIENAYTNTGSQANFLPTDLFENKESLSLTTSPIALANGVLQNKKTNTQQPQTSQPIIVKEIVVAKAEAPTPSTTDVVESKTIPVEQVKPVIKRFHVVVGSTTDRKKAEELLEELKAKNHLGAEIIGTERLRICINSYANREEAEKEVRTLREGTTFGDAWLYVK